MQANSLTPVGAARPLSLRPGGVVWADAWKLYGGEVPPPALVVAIGSPAVGASVSEASVAWR